MGPQTAISNTMAFPNSFVRLRPLMHTVMQPQPAKFESGMCWDFSSSWPTSYPKTKVLSFANAEFECTIKRRLGTAVSIDSPDPHGHSKLADGLGGIDWLSLGESKFWLRRELPHQVAMSSALQQHPHIPTHQWTDMTTVGLILWRPASTMTMGHRCSVMLPCSPPYLEMSNHNQAQVTPAAH